MLILRPATECLVAHTMFYANEVRPAPRLNLENQFSDKELSMATTLMKGYSGEFDPAEFKDLYQERIHKIIEAQMSGIEQGTRPAPVKPQAKVPDLMEQIRLSLAQIESKNAGNKDSKKPAQKTGSAAKKKPHKVRA